MGRCSGRTVSPQSGILNFWVDENVQPSPSQNWVQYWVCCPGQLEPLVDNETEGETPNFRETTFSIGEEKQDLSGLNTYQSRALNFEEVEFLATEPLKEDRADFGSGDCHYVERTGSVSITGIWALTTGDEVLSSMMTCGGCVEVISIRANTRGKNPTKAAVSAALGNDTLRAIAWQESRWRQFGGDGKPLVNRNSNGTADWGIMQINQADYIQHWDWRANVARGARILEEKRRHAKVYLGRHPPYSPEMLETEALQRYNGGRYYQWNKENKKWEAAPKNGYVASIKAILAARPW